MAGSATDIIAPCVTTPNIQSIKECLQRCERQFVVDNDRGPTSEEQWTQVTKHKPRPATRWKGKGRKELSFSDNQAFVQGIYVVAMALRCAYLVDSILINKNHAETFNKHFSSMEEYRNVAFLREESTEQVYIVNRRLLKARTRNRNNQRASSSLAGEEILWLQTDWGKPILPTSIPQSLNTAIVNELLLGTLDQGDVSGSEASGNIARLTSQPRDVPALSAWLLEYPVGYTFSDDSAVSPTRTADDTTGAVRERMERTNLDGEPLVLVKVKIVGDKELGRSYDLLAFSYPSKLLDEPGSVEHGTLASGSGSAASEKEVRQFLQRIPAILKERYETRLKGSELGERPVIEVTTERVRLEKVVL